MWDYVSGTVTCPKSTDNDYDKLTRMWNIANAKIITWINNSVESSIGIHLAKRYQINMDLREAKQGERSIQEFYSYLTELWDQLALMDPTELAKDRTYQKLWEEHKLVELLMALRDDFENLRSFMLHQSHLPTVSIIVNELLAKKTRLKSLHLMSYSGSS
ncbi:hypothetical protein EZV62_008511 [Acer yangbiense]|uniref:Retrotransposon gag domain-containing protein n=1 Tax=Acer yangbiense TaxID=1000413 RepID=A0A5C7IFL5_9ROSI|nr:hypothetical protein EZV62_008511 [Acer yangbiense]